MLFRSTKNELIGEVIGLLQAPIQRVIGALQNKDAAKAEAAEAQVAEAPLADASVTVAETPVAEAVVATEPAAVVAPIAEVVADAAAETNSTDGEAKPAETPEA